MPERSRAIVAALLAAILAGCAATGGSEPCVVEKPTRSVACTMEYNPVCGCDGKTYGNACVARASGVPQSTPGECQKRDLD